MTRAGWQPERPCPIPGHPQDAAGDGPRPVTESAWARLRAWLLHAPAERLPLPAAAVTWPSAWIMHALRIPAGAVACLAAAATMVTWLAWAWRHRRARKARQAAPGSQQPRPRDLFSPAEAALVAAAWGGWVTAAVAAGPAARPDRWPTLLYLAGAAGGYWWLRRHQAVRAARARRDQAAAELADKRLWHQILPRAGLGGWHVQWRRDTRLGEERLITTSPENALASRIAASSRAIAEKLEHILGLPYHRVDVTTTDYPGQLIIGIRTVDLSVREAAYHPMTTPWPEPEPSPFAAWFPETASIRDPLIWGFCPEDGTPLTIQLFSEIGGRAVGVIGATGSGKSNLLNCVREGITRRADARLVQLNGAHMGDELVWEPLAALTLCGPVRTDDQVRGKIAAALEALCLLVTNRSATLADTGHSTFQPTPEHPAVEIVIDEVDEIVKHVPGAGAALEFLASKQRKSAVGLLLATQRAVIASLGGGGVRANMSEVLIGHVERATESRHATGAETGIPDIREYAKGAPGYFQRWNPKSGEINGRGRGFLLGKPPEELAYIKRLVEDRRNLRDWSIPDLPPLAPGGGQSAGPAASDATTPQIAGLRGRLASITQAATQPQSPAAAPAPPVPAIAVPPGIPPGDGQALLRFLAEAAPGGVSAAEARQAIGKSKSRMGDYLRIFEKRGIVVRTGNTRASRYRLASQASTGPQPEPAPARPNGYVTIEALADAVHDGLAEVDDDTRAVLEQARQIRDRAARRSHLTIVPDPESDAS
jgi:energy-coupling factor transporter ATP-binding protein EcfA2